jgi:hypothetical protein
MATPQAPITPPIRTRLRFSLGSPRGDVPTITPPDSPNNGPQIRRTQPIRQARLHAPPLVFLTTPTPTPRKTPHMQLAELFEFFDGSTLSMREETKHLPSLSLRRDCNFWTDPTDGSDGYERQRAAVGKLYMRFLSSIAEMMCGGGAANASIHWFTNWVYGVPERNKKVYQSVQAFVVAKKMSMERRMLRAVMCGLYPLSEINAVIDTINSEQGNATTDVLLKHIGDKTFTRGRKDFQHLMQYGRLVQDQWTRAKFDKDVVDLATRFILSLDNVAYRLSLLGNEEGDRRWRYTHRTIHSPQDVGFR